MDGVIQSYNPDFFWPTTIIFIGSLAFYMYKFFYLRRQFEREPSLFSNNNNSRNTNQSNGNSQSNQTNNYTSNNYNNSARSHLSEGSLTNSTYFNDNNEDAPFINSTRSVYYDNINKNEEKVIESNANTGKLNLFFQSTHNSRKVPLSVSLDQTFDTIINTLQLELDYTTETHKVMVIFLGKKIEKNKKIGEVLEIKEGTIIHLFISAKSEEELNQGRNRESSGNNSSSSNSSGNNSNSSGSRNNSESINNDNSRLSNGVLLSTIKIHVVILIIFCVFLYQYKKDNRVLNKTALILLQVLAIFWAWLASKTVAKLLTYKTIIYDNNLDSEEANSNNHYN